MNGQDCDCLTHDGPHWQHMDRLHHESNRKLLEAGLDETRGSWDRWMALAGYIQEEQHRLAEKAGHLRGGADAEAKAAAAA